MTSVTNSVINHVGTANTKHKTQEYSANHRREENCFPHDRMRTKKKRKKKISGTFGRSQVIWFLGIRISQKDQTFRWLPIHEHFHNSLFHNYFFIVLIFLHSPNFS